MNAPDDPESGGGQEERIRALERKANQALSDAELLLENGSREAAINRAYYAVFQAAPRVRIPKTHSGVIRRTMYHDFGKLLENWQTNMEEAPPHGDCRLVEDYGQDTLPIAAAICGHSL
mgnify:CR=1 FL=1